MTRLRHKLVKRDVDGVTTRHTLPRSSSTRWGHARTLSPRCVTRGVFESDNALDTHALTGGTDEVGCARGDSPRGTDCCSRPSALPPSSDEQGGPVQSGRPSSPRVRHRGEREGAEGKGKAPRGKGGRRGEYYTSLATRYYQHVSV